MNPSLHLSRREFLHTGSAAALGLALTVSLSHGQQASTKKIPVGLQL